MAERRRLFAPEYGTAPFTAGAATAPPMPPPDGKPPMRLPIAGTSPSDHGGRNASAAPQAAPGDALDGDPYTQLVQLLQMAGRI